MASRGAQKRSTSHRRAAGGKPYRGVPLNELGGDEDAGERDKFGLVALDGLLAARAQVAVKVVHRGPGRLPRELVVIAHLDVCSGRQGSGQAGGDRQRAAGQEGTRLMTPPQEDFGRRRAARPSRGLVWTRYGGTQ